MSKKSSPSSLANALVNVLIPVLILSYCSKGDNSPLSTSGDEKLWHLGPWTAMAIAICLPLAYGLIQLVKHRKLETMSLIGLIGVLLTGAVTILVVSSDGQILPSTPWLYGIKEGAIPLMFAFAFWLTRNRKDSLFNTFLLNPDIFDLPAIHHALATNHKQPDFSHLLLRGNKLIVSSFCLSSILNVLLSWYLISPVLELPAAEQQVAYNSAVGQVMLWGLLVIGLPMIAMIGIILKLMVSSISQLTGLSTDRILMRR